MSFQKVDGFAVGLVAMQRAGLLYWSDSGEAQPENPLFDSYSFRMVHLSPHRRDFDETKLREYAAANQLFTKIAGDEPTRANVIEPATTELNKL
ncbi:hypothetical protein [Atlantibacter hermannii]|uniref:hypothetical protein n=1 Tax=Atlantibacter hermannii TaxID=565 RepID=UPI0028A6D718|nr:hypothetical protein [Atlantibacter hermannii]